MTKLARIFHEGLFWTIETVDKMLHSRPSRQKGRVGSRGANRPLSPIGPAVLSRVSAKGHRRRQMHQPVMDVA